MGSFKDLIVWKRAEELAFQVYRETRRFPKDELYGMTSQMRRAAVSVVANIAEGSGRRNRNETRQFFNIAIGSLTELEALLGLSKRLELMGEVSFQLLDGLRKEAGALLGRLYHSL